MLVLIPARYASSRLPGKPLADLGGKPLIQRVYEAVSACPDVETVAVATDDDRIRLAVEAFGGRAVMTSEKHLSGTDRCAEALEKLGGGFELVVNVQGDEPFVGPEQLMALGRFMRDNPDFSVGTLVHRISSVEELENPHVVKAVVGDGGRRALYFSRSPVPHLRGVPLSDWLQQGHFYRHIGLYAFRGDTLAAMAKMAPTALEEMESLEQLRWLENGLPIGVCETGRLTMGIDTPEDLDRARILWGK
jgi:3-deoxy-manno-octulosonate cytidylyltransferase (CMP-KDO synthetase)